jgi:protease PrsW
VSSPQPSSPWGFGPPYQQPPAQYPQTAQYAGLPQYRQPGAAAQYYPVPEFRQQHEPERPGRFHYRARRNALQSRGLRLGVLVVGLALCGAAILAMVQRQTGTSGFLVGLTLAVLPVPFVLGALTWLDRVEPKPVRNLVFCFAWGACAATLVALLANTWTADLLVSHQGARGETIGAAVVAPLVEETSKGAAVLLLFLYRRRDFDGITDGIVLAGFTACGFAFTENVLYLGRSYTEDQVLGDGLGGTFTTFILRGVMSPFAHPLFTAMTGIGFGLAAASRGRVLRVTAPLGGWVLAVLLHGMWNGAAALGSGGFLLVYLLFMVPAFGGLVGLAVWSRSDELRVIGRQLPVYAWAGWLGHAEPVALSAMRLRRQARRRARQLLGPMGSRVMNEYIAFATTLAFLRLKAERGTDAVSAFTEREHELLYRLWERRPAVAPILAEVGAPPMPPWARPPVPPQWAGPPRPYGVPGQRPY